MDKRLEEIKQRFKAMNELPSFKKLAPTELFFDDLDYLIQQAEVSKEWQIVANNTYADLIKAERRVKELEDKLYELNESAYETQIDFSEANGKKNSLLEQNQRYKQALEFYADEDNYEEDKFNMFAETPVVKYDKGEKARQALGTDKP